MATLYLDFSGGADTNTGSGSWANAYKTLKEAVEQCVNDNGAGPHTILWDNATPETLTGDTTITAVCDLQIISVDRATELPEVGAAIGTQVTNYNLTLTGPYKVYVYGVDFRNGSAAGSGRYVAIGTANGSHFEIEDCSCTVVGSASSSLNFGNGNSGSNCYLKVRNFTYTTSSSGHVLYFAKGFCELENFTLAGTPVLKLISGSSTDGTNVTFTGSDLSNATGILVGNLGAFGTARYRFVNSAINPTTVLDAATLVLNKGQTTVELFNCSYGDNHYAFAHYDAFGSTVADDTIYANDGAKYDGTNGCSWKITTTANCSFYTPYVSPWFSQYAEAGTVTPTVEIVRDGSATAYQDDEVWGEFSYQGTSGSTKATIVSTRTAVWPLAPDDIPTGDLGAGDWTGENATAWFGKLSPGSITINEIGHLSARIVVGEPSITVGADPTIRV